MTSISVPVALLGSIGDGPRHTEQRVPPQLQLDAETCSRGLRALNELRALHAERKREAHRATSADKAA